MKSDLPEAPATWQFWIDVGGTFTDCLARSPDGREHELKLLSSSVIKYHWKGGDIRRNGLYDPRVAAPVDDFWRGYDLAWLDQRGQSTVVAHVTQSRAEGALRFEVAGVWPSDFRPAYFELRSREPSPLFAARRLTGRRLDQSLPAIDMKLGTTRGTNALLTRQGAPVVLAVTAGFGDLLEIGEQHRDDLFARRVVKRHPLYRQVIEIQERLNADGHVLQPLNVDHAERELTAALANGCTSLAICLLHAYRNANHEEALERVARRVGFTEISRSSLVAPLIKIVPRAETTVLDAYLNPVIRSYLIRIAQGLSSSSRLEVMSSHGGLVPLQRFSGKDSILSGPAGGVVGFARAAEQAGFGQALGFDMGGTSTDVARYGGEFEKEFESAKAGVRIVAPLLAIETVAAGGGSICRFNGTQLVVGPESAGADPGPASYGQGGPLTVTDINVFLGRIEVSQFPFALDHAAIERRLDECLREIATATGRPMNREELADGFLKIANHNMAAAIRSISVAKGYDPTAHVLVAFGGAGPQHACGVASLLNLRQILVNPRASLMSAAGIRLADRRAELARAVLRPLSSRLLGDLEADFAALTDAVINTLEADGGHRASIAVRRSLDLRFSGTEPFLNVPLEPGVDIRMVFLREHRRLFGYIQDRTIEVVAARAEGVIAGERPPLAQRVAGAGTPQSAAWQRCWTGTEWLDVPQFTWDELWPGARMVGPALIASPTTTVWLEPGWKGELLSNRALLLEATDLPQRKASLPANKGVLLEPDPIHLEIFSNSFRSIARQMGITLQRTSVSVNIKDRLDFSCAIFRANGDLIVNAPHIPVHLGAMSETVREVIARNPVVHDGDVFVTNDPYAGGSHLPDVSVVTPVFAGGQLAFWVASRGHHAEIGGKTPGSMPPDATCLADEGVVIANFKLIDAGQENFVGLERLLSSGRYPSRNIPDNLADIRAQVAANRMGANALRDLIEVHSLPVVDGYMKFLLDAAQQQVQDALRRFADGRYAWSDAMDNGRRIQVAITKQGDRITIDFSGTDPVSLDNLNANRPICLAAIMYTMRCLLDTDLPLNEGVLRPVELRLPECFLNPRPGPTPEASPPIVGGNVETSQRVVDVLWGALGLAAASQGTMNNWLMGDETFGYYETIGGGSGATQDGPGADAVHTHMTNTRLTDPEVLETRFPVRLLECRIAAGTGGKGRYTGGCGMIRTIEFLRPLVVSLLTSRRITQPYGLEGGGPGARGQNLVKRVGERWQCLPSRTSFSVRPGDQLRIITPGGGGWGNETT